MSQNKKSTTTDDSSSKVIERKATSGSGSLDSFYNMIRDRPMRKQTSTIEKNKNELRKNTYVLIDENSNKDWNILKAIHVESDLRLSLLLNLTTTTGIATFLSNPFQMNEYTRILFYSYEAYQEEISEQAVKASKQCNIPKINPDETHVITRITFGIDVLIILQLPTDRNNIQQVERVIDKIRRLLTTNDKNGALTTEDEQILRCIKSTMVYSNVAELTKVQAISDVPERINRIKNSNKYEPISYSLRSCQWRFQHHQQKDAMLCILPSNQKETLENYVLPLRNMKNKLDIFFKDEQLNVLMSCLKNQITDARKKYNDIKQKYDKNIKQLNESLINVRSTKENINQIEKELNKPERRSLINQMNELLSIIQTLKLKANLIHELQRELYIEYRNANDDGIGKGNDENDIMKRIKKGGDGILICSNDNLYKKNPEELKKLCTQAESDRKKNPNLYIIFVDFSYCEYELKKMTMLFCYADEKDKNLSKPRSTSLYNSQSSSSTTTTSLPNRLSINRAAAKPEQFQSTFIDYEQISEEPTSLPEMLKDDTINLLLLGETGVGKSTFINSFANYLAYNSIEDAKSNDPIVLLNVSFLITTGEFFEEHIIKFVDSNDPKNEDHDHPGQSVTQQCRSYVFPSRHRNGKKIRIIDTPGFGDTRGIDQDIQNMENILQYIDYFTHLNGICFLFKPNESRLNMFFRTCFTELFSLLDAKARQNIIFCFTNSRSTFYTPGDSAPLLNQMLQSLPNKDISFNRDNTFCFDSESFRYLVALQNGIEFNADEKTEYEKSWSVSVKQSIRLLEYVSTKLPVYDMKNGYRSIKHVQMEIKFLSRPILETIRNILRNKILHQKKLSNELIIMIPKHVYKPVSRCLLCKLNSKKVGPFGIIPDKLHEMKNDCVECHCPRDQHVPMNYKLQYECSNNNADIQQNIKMFDYLPKLFDAVAKFSYFLKFIVRCSEDDPISIQLAQMIASENSIVNKEKQNDFNQQLVVYLREVQTKHQENVHQLQKNNQNIDPTNIYDLINKIKKFPIINEQMKATKKSQDTMMERYEHKIESFDE